jgi:hypothetical protein
LELPQAARDQAGAVQIDRELRLTGRIFRPASLDRQVPAIELASQPLPNLSLERRKLTRKLRIEVEVPVIDAADLDSEPAAGHGALRRAEPGHAVGHARSLKAGKPGNLVPEMVDW